MVADLAGAGEQRVTALTRVLLAATALGSTRMDPAEPSRFVAATYTVLSLYLAHAVWIWTLTRRRPAGLGKWHWYLPWVDIAIYSVLIAISGGSNSIYFALFFFGILIASVQGGFGYGVLVTAASAAAFTLVGYLSRPAELFEVDRFVLRATTLPVLGYLMAYRGGYELRLRRRLALLRDLSTASNPRFGPQRMLARSLQCLREFFDADLVMGLLPRSDGRLELRHVTRTQRDLAEEDLSPALAGMLMAFPATTLVCFRPERRRPLTVLSADGTAVTATAEDSTRCHEIAELLGGRGFLTVPLRAGSRATGRLYIAADHPSFDPRDTDFVLQAGDQIMPALAHIELVERMATRAAEDERQRIALDIHDRVIQPYIGLKMGVAAAHACTAELPDNAASGRVRRQLAKLDDLAGMAISELRGYVQGLREGRGAEARLAESLRRFGERFQEATGIIVTVDVEADVTVDERLGAEVFSMANEAVSNIHRHTTATHARIFVRQAAERLILQVDNPRDASDGAVSFVPRSIVRRAETVNAVVAVESGVSGMTTVKIEIPL